MIYLTRSSTVKPEKPTMTIEIRDASLEARIQKRLQSTGSSSVEEVLLRLLEKQEKRDRRLLEVQPCMSGKTALGL
jgi:predicted CopG family antitoxin